MPSVDPDRAEALMSDAIAKHPLPSASMASLDRALNRLPEAIADSDAEAQAAK